MKVLCVIPSRIGSTRLPNKPLLLIQGKPMIQWVYENASRCEAIDKIIVATDNLKIAETVEKAGGEALMTDPNLQTGSDRVAAVSEQYPEYEVVINLQGDEPFIKPKMLRQLITPYLNGESPEITTLAYPIEHEEEFTNPGIVKVITDKNSDAIYFSRAAIPYFRSKLEVPVYHHMGLYAFKRDFLMHYKTLAQTPLELAEGLEQLRAMEYGHKIRVCLTEDKTLEINTPTEFDSAQLFIYQED